MKELNLVITSELENNDLTSVNWVGDTIVSSLNNYIKGSGVIIYPRKDYYSTYIAVRNSRGGQTPGFIQIPVEAIPDTIQALERIYYASRTKRV